MIIIINIEQNFQLAVTMNTKDNSSTNLRQMLHRHEHTQTDYVLMLHKHEYTRSWVDVTQARIYTH